VDCGFIDRSAAGAAQVFVLDESFSGTNTVERLGFPSEVIKSALATVAAQDLTGHADEEQRTSARGIHVQGPA
jgi:hypothetical protein